MLLHHCAGNPGTLTINTPAVFLTIVLGLVYFGSRKILKNGISPIALIGLSAVAGIVVYG